MEVRIGVQHVAREIVIESKQTPDEVRELVTAALEGGTPLTLADERGRTVTVPVGVLGYVDVGTEQPFKVGFGS